MTTPEVDIACQCKGCCRPCGNEMTQEDLLCDVCRDRGGHCNGLHSSRVRLAAQVSPDTKALLEQLRALDQGFADAIISDLNHLHIDSIPGGLNNFLANRIEERLRWSS